MLFAKSYHVVEKKILVKYFEIISKNKTLLSIFTKKILMKILVIAATEKEIEPIYEVLQKNCNLITNNLITTIIGGVGQTSSAFTITKTLSEAKFDLVINAGIAGSYNKSLKIGQTVWVKNEQFPDLGAETESGILNLNEIGLSDNKNRIIKSEFLNSNLFPKNIEKVNGITSDTIHSLTNTTDWIIRKYSPDVESMEGGAIMFCCNKFKVPCVQIRSISNYVGVRDKSKWDIDLAIKNLNKYLISYINEI